MRPRTGEQYYITSGNQRCCVTELGATLRSYEIDERPVCWGFAEDQLSGGGRGQVLAPWPNRLEDGLYEFEGVHAKVPHDEPDRDNAIHGLVRFVPWRLVGHDDDAVRLALSLLPQPAYPFYLDLELEYRLDETGLTVSLAATNRDDGPLPFGVGFHPYLFLGDDLVDEARVALPVSTHYETNERLLPIGVEDAATSPFAVVVGRDARTQDVVGPIQLDECFGGIELDPDGRWRAEVLGAARSVPDVIWADGRYRYIMCYSADTVAEADRRRAIAIEPMTCPANAFRTGEELIVLEPGARFEARFGITPGECAR